MNKLERLTAILLLLQDRARTSEELARHFEVSKRTILRDIQALSEMGVPVIAREGVGGGYSLSGEYRVAPFPLTVREAFLLLLALSSISQLSDAPFAAERASLAAKLRAALPAPQLAQVESLLGAVAVEVPEREQRAPHLEALLEAARARRWVVVDYDSAERRSRQHILPIKLTTQNGYWYCQAYSVERQAERVYRVDRVAALAPPEVGFQAPPVPDPVPYDHPDHPELVVSLTAAGVRALEVDPQLGPIVARQPDGSGVLRQRVPPSDLDWFARFFAGFGSDADVQAPVELRQRMQALGHLLLDRYR
jgi:predicted DNA-binding transcriptional regulator YafY